MEQKREGDAMEHYDIIKELINTNKNEFSIEEFASLSNLSEIHSEKVIKDLCDAKLMAEIGQHFFLTEKARIDFANSYSKNVMSRFLLFSMLAIVVLYFLAKIIF